MRWLLESKERIKRGKFKMAWLAILLAAFFAVALNATSRKAPASNIGSVIRGDLIQRVTIAGSVNPNRKTIISAPYSGYVRKLFVQIGDQVRAGDPIVSIAQSLRGSAEDIFPLRAPFSGTVVQVLKTEGEYVDQQSAQGNGNALVRIDDLTKLFIEANSPEIEVGKLKLGQEAVIKASAVLERSYKGKIQHISLAAKEQKDWDKSRVEFPVLIEITDKDQQIKPGMSVIIDVITNKITNALILRHEFIQKKGEKYFVITENGGRKDIEVGLQNEEAFEIKSGVAENEKILQVDFLSITKEE